MSEVVDIHTDDSSKKDKDNKYGIVIDSGSSGSRIQVYRWKNPAVLAQSSDETILQSPPKIFQGKDWTKKISPGISSYGLKGKVKKIWLKHYSELMKFAESIVPVEKQAETPVFVLSTAGMRLLPKKTQDAILLETCRSIKSNTNFYLPDCSSFVQIIDGSTEGIYGWLGLNYLMGSFQNYDSKKTTNHESIGFMDMGGASTQIAFVPSSSEQIEKHKEDLSSVTIRNINGETQEWNVFVATWLGFGANEARKRYIEQMITLASVNEELHNNINDPCLPKGASITYEFQGRPYKISGVGNFEMCTRSIYPLLMKSIPCEDEPCLFNGIHGPKLDFEKDKFVGISEYWYTANDIFQSGGEYDYKTFNLKAKGYCESNWEQILINAKNGQYSGLDPDKFLKDACFKATWVMNVLHDGFELPRLGIELNREESGDADVNDVTEKHVPFKSAESVGGEELSWTLGKILLYASSQIESSNKDSGSMKIGIQPSDISGNSFIPGGTTIGKEYFNEEDYSDDEKDSAFGHAVYSILFFLLLIFFIYNFGKGHFGKWKNGIHRFHFPPRELKMRINSALSKVPVFGRFLKLTGSYQELERDINLEEGIGFNGQSGSPLKNTVPHSSVLRTRSAIDINDEYESSTRVSPVQNVSNTANNLHFNPRVNNFLNKPFVVPKKNGQPYYFFSENNNSRESLSRNPTGSSIVRTKSSME
ncbi:YND1 [Candida oxycetoniae]|uniref:YND1 n=1 Tax=Candida oxycetoniae TaxID=497107 RepID=A0AAI9SUW5_9ASCO|nr:YND1 [Candida oxycetoniae]KAI3403148.2 YND1 [Candida oxycetoniae]